MMTPHRHAPLPDAPSQMLVLFKGAYLLLWAAYVFHVCLTQPYLNWDIIGYVASAHHMAGLTGEVLRQTTFDDVQRFVPPAVFEDLTNAGSAYRATVFADPLALEQQLPFYTIRYAYVGAVMALGHVLGSVAQATVIVSAAAAALIVLASGALVWAVRPVAVFLAVPPALILCDLLVLGRLSTPDALAALAAVLLCVAMARGARGPALLMIALLPMFRTDYVIFALAAAGILFWLGDRRAGPIAAVLALAAYGLANHLSGNYGHAVIFNFTLITGPQPYPQTLTLSSDLSVYLDVYRNGYRRLMQDNDAILIGALLATGAFLLVGREARARNRLMWLHLAALVFVTAHFLLFPAAFARNYFLLSWTSVLSLAEAIRLSRTAER